MLVMSIYYCVYIIIMLTSCIFHLCQFTIMMFTQVPTFFAMFFSLHEATVKKTKKHRKREMQKSYKKYLKQFTRNATRKLLLTTVATTFRATKREKQRFRRDRRKKNKSIKMIEVAEVITATPIIYPILLLLTITLVISYFLLWSTETVQALAVMVILYDFSCPPISASIPAASTSTAFMVFYTFNINLWLPFCIYIII